MRGKPTILKSQIFQKLYNYEMARTIPKVLFVENNQLLRTLISNLVAKYPMELVGSIDSYQGAVDLFTKQNPDVVLLDFDLGEGPNGYQLAVLMRQMKPELGIVFLSNFNDERFVVGKNLHKLKNYVFLRKSEIVDHDAIFSAIMQSIGTIQSDLPPRNWEISSYYDGFNEREIKLMACIASGYSNKKIASIFQIEVKSCENAISKLAKKLDLPKKDSSNQRILITRKYLQLCGKEIS
jgi:DNA-binding NarL/FixJ family response regulator